MDNDSLLNFGLQVYSPNLQVLILPFWCVIQMFIGWHNPISLFSLMFPQPLGLYKKWLLFVQVLVLIKCIFRKFHTCLHCIFTIPPILYHFSPPLFTSFPQKSLFHSPVYVCFLSLWVYPRPSLWLWVWSYPLKPGELSNDSLSSRIYLRSFILTNVM